MRRPYFLNDRAGKELVKEPHNRKPGAAAQMRALSHRHARRQYKKLIRLWYDSGGRGG